MVSVLKCCLVVAVCFFFVLLQVFAGALFSLCLGDQRGFRKEHLEQMLQIREEGIARHEL